MGGGVVAWVEAVKVGAGGGNTDTGGGRGE